MRINFLDTEETDLRVEIVPLIDVIFCILTFFILAALQLTRQQAINLDLPKASTGVAQTRQTMLVSIDPVGQIYIDKQAVNQDQLYAQLLSYTRTQPNGIIVLNASPLVSYNQVIQVLDLLRSVGGQRVALATQPTNKPALSTETPAGVLPLTPLPGNPQPVNPPLEGLPPLINPTQNPSVPIAPSPLSTN